MVLLTTVLLGIVRLCHADLHWSGDTISVPGRIKNPEAFAAAHRVASGSSSSDSSPVQAAVGSPLGGIATDEILGRRDLALFDRQTCPPTHPFPCAGKCCPVGSPVCCISVNGGCCASNKPVCQPNGCCATGSTQCPNDSRTCRKPGETCCGNGGTCPSNKPVCSPGNLCCPSGTTLCPNDPTMCKELDEQCCGAGFKCPVWASCCGTGGACCDSTNPKISQCCPGSSPDKDTCCGEHEVCCDGWCCPESSTCSTTPGYCNVPVLEFGYTPNSIISDLVENVCLGLRRQIALQIPETTPNQQILTYYGPGSPNRELSDCRSGRKCCTGTCLLIAFDSGDT
jgi:hypothetical protein